MYHYFNLIHCRLTNVLACAAGSFHRKYGGPVRPDVDEICRSIALELQDEEDAGILLFDAWMYHRFGPRMAEHEPELPPVSVEEALVLAPDVATGPLKEYVEGKCTLGDAVSGCLFLTYMDAFRLLGDVKGRPYTNHNN